MQFTARCLLFLLLLSQCICCTISPTDRSVIAANELHRFMGYTYHRNEVVLIHVQNPETGDWHFLERTLSDVRPNQYQDSPEGFFWEANVRIPERYYGFNHDGRLAAHLRVTSSGGIRGDDGLIPGEVEGQGELLPGLRATDGLRCVFDTWNEGRILDMQQCFSGERGSVIVVFGQ